MFTKNLSFEKIPHIWVLQMKQRPTYGEFLWVFPTYSSHIRTFFRPWGLTNWKKYVKYKIVSDLLHLCYVLLIKF